MLSGFPVPPEVVAEMRRLRAEGVPAFQIAQRLCCDVSTVYRHTRDARGEVRRDAN